MYLFRGVHMYVCVSACTHVYENGWRPEVGIGFSVVLSCSPAYFLRQVLSPNLVLTSWLHWLISRFQVSACLCSPDHHRGRGVTPCLVFMWVLKNQTQILMPLWQTVSQQATSQPSLLSCKAQLKGFFLGTQIPVTTFCLHLFTLPLILEYGTYHTLL